MTHARARSRSRTPGVAVAGGFPMSAGGVVADLDFDFQNGQYFQTGQGADPLVLTTTSRASTAYAVDTSGTWTAFLSNVPRITDKGLLVESGRTNSIRNNSMQGAVVGTPGTLPTNWAVSTANSLTTNVIAISTTNGVVDYIDVQVTGTPGASGFYELAFEAGTQIAASNGQAWAISGFAALAAGSTTNTAILQFLWSENNSGGTPLARHGTSNFTSALTSTLTRFNVSTTNTNASTAFVRPYIRIGTTTGAAINITLRIGWPQLELGAFAASPIRTTTAAATRAADVVTVTTVPAFGSAYTLFNKATPNAPITYATNQVSLGINDGTANERSRTRRVATTGVGQGVTTTGGVDTVVASGMVSIQGLSRRIAFAIANLDQAVSQNANAIVTGMGALPSTPTVITIGTDQSTTLQYDGYIERVAIWAATRLSNGVLQRITQ